MNKIKIGIVDDEPDAIALIEMIIREFYEHAEVVMTASTVDEAWEAIKLSQPELLILDIDMPRGNGFDLLERFPIRRFDIIFVTAYSKYRDKAQKYGAYDYLNKPVDIELLTSILERFRSEKHLRQQPFRLKH